MKTGPGGATIRQIGQLFEVGTVAGLCEVQLLERFVARRDEPAFAALVSRHGPMVLGVCRRLLADPLDVEDAFQATFLVLVRRAGSIRDRDRLAPWLFGVARRVATRARLDRSRRLARERPGAGVAAAAPAIDEQRAELGRALVDEIERLPESLRLPVVFCCVDGLSYEEAADRLESTVPAIRGRLSRSREQLRIRLTRRGFAPALGAMGALISAEVASAAVPATLFASTVRIAIGFSAGRAATAGAVPAAVVTLAEGVIRTMILTKSKLVAATLVACGVAASGVGVFGMQDAAPLPPDRLGNVEQKLDRLINLLERATTPAPAMSMGMPGSMMMARPPAPPMMGGGPPAPPVPPPPPGEASKAASPAGGRGMAGMMERMGGYGMMGGPGMMGMGQSDPTNSSSTSARLDVVEGRLARLEARLAEVERKLGSLPSSEWGQRNPPNAGQRGPSDDRNPLEQNRNSSDAVPK
jgi:RNA polymerase sigma factor (sigma-70 family)